MAADKILTIGYLNIRGQTGLPVTKQLQIEAFMKYNNCDILHLQEANIEDDSFTSCEFVSSSCSILQNNSTNKYGTASLIKTDLQYDNVQMDSNGRVIIFDVGEFTFGNIYLPSGTDGASRTGREKYCCEVMPRLLINCKEAGCIGGDFNCIVDNRDATQYPESKLSKGLQRLMKLRDWKDSYRTLYPNTLTFSRYYENARAEGATRIDRNYHFGNLDIREVKYIPVAFSDHFGLVVKLCLPDSLSRMISPKSRPSFKLKPEVIRDSIFKERLKDSMVSWERIRAFQGDTLETLFWWEKMVKPGIRKLGIQRSKELNKERREELNLYLLRQTFLVKKVQQGQRGKLGELKTINLLIEKWYLKESEKVQHQSRVREFQDNEKSSIYHHELHKRIIKKSSILRLQTNNGVIEGHEACAKFLESIVEDLLLHPATLDPVAQEALLAEIVPVFSEEDNRKMLTPPTCETVLKTVNASNLYAAPGTDGLPSLLYKECWSELGVPLTDVMVEISRGSLLPPSMRTSLMVFGSKPKKPNSILPGDKRRISLLNSDFKVASGLEADMLKATGSHTLSPLQLVAGSDRRIHRGINIARNAIYDAGKPGHQGCGILLTSYAWTGSIRCLAKRVWTGR